MTPEGAAELLRQARHGTSDVERKLAASILLARGVNPFPMLVGVTPVQTETVTETPRETVKVALLTNSRLKTARACSRLDWLKYELGYRALVTVDALRFGTLLHLVLEAWWKARQEERLERALAALEGAEADPFDRARASALITGYHHRWIDEPYEALVLEAEFCTPLRNPATGRPSKVWQLAGKLDGAVRNTRDGRQLILEHKTASGDISPGSEYWRRLRMDGQVSAYYVGAESMGLDVSGCLYDVVGKPGIRPLKATPHASRKYTKTGELYANQRETDETPEEFHARLLEDIAADPSRYYQRGEVVRLDSELEDARFDTWQLAQQIHEANKAGRHPRNPEACTSYGRTCEFFDACTGAASLEDTTRFVQSDDVHPELSGAAASLERGEK
jgi:hypothetical protein